MRNILIWAIAVVFAFASLPSLAQNVEDTAIKPLGFVATIDTEMNLRIHEYHNREFLLTVVTLIPIYYERGRPFTRGIDINIPVTEHRYLDLTKPRGLYTLYISNIERFLCPNYQVSEVAQKKCDRLMDQLITVRIVVTSTDEVSKAVNVSLER